MVIWEFSFSQWRPMIIIYWICNLRKLFLYGKHNHHFINFLASFEGLQFNHKEIFLRIFIQVFASNIGNNHLTFAFFPLSDKVRPFTSTQQRNNSYGQIHRLFGISKVLLHCVLGHQWRPHHFFRCSLIFRIYSNWKVSLHARRCIRIDSYLSDTIFSFLRTFKSKVWHRGSSFFLHSIDREFKYFKQVPNGNQFIRDLHKYFLIHLDDPGRSIVWSVSFNLSDCFC